MKYKSKLKLSIISLISCSVVHFNVAQEPKRNLEASDRPVIPAELGKSKNNASTSTDEIGGIAASDAGAQRPVKVKKGGVSTFFGYNSKYFYRSNPLMSGTKLSNQKTAMWTNTFYSGVGLGVIDTDTTVITPYVGASWTINDYIEGGLDKLNYNSTGAYAMLLAQYGSGWSSRVGVSYASDSSTEFDTEDYKEYYPNLGVMKAVTLSDSVLGIFDASAGKHITDTLNIFKGTDDGNLDNWEMAGSYGLKWNPSERLSFSPQYRLSYKIYDDGNNKDREDLTNMFSLRIAYQLASSVTLDLSSSYTDRSTSGRTGLDFKNMDTGGGLSLTARF